MLSSLDWKIRDFARDKLIVRERSPAADAVIVRAGIVCRQVAGDTGQRQIASLHFPGDLVNLDSCYLGIATTSLQAMTAASVAMSPRDTFLAFLDSHEGANRAVWIASMADAAEARMMAANLARKSARARVANLLCQIAFRLDEDEFRRSGEFHQPLSQKQIADATSLTSIHVNRVLRSLDSDGLLRRSRACYQVPDIQALAELGAFEPEHQQRLRHEASALLWPMADEPAAFREARRA